MWTAGALGMVLILGPGFASLCSGRRGAIEAGTLLAIAVEARTLLGALRSITINLRGPSVRGSRSGWTSALSGAWSGAGWKWTPGLTVWCTGWLALVALIGGANFESLLWETLGGIGAFPVKTLWRARFRRFRTKFGGGSPGGTAIRSLEPIGAGC